MGVYDGHGTKGKEASLFINNAIKKLITDNKNKLKKWSMQANSREVITKMFVNGYKKIQQQMKKDMNF
jgi:serine/threonine protein phosphatase PrpC